MSPEFIPGTPVRISGGLEASVVAFDGELVEVKLDGESTGRYPVDQVEVIHVVPVEEEG